MAIPHSAPHQSKHRIAKALDSLMCHDTVVLLVVAGAVAYHFEKSMMRRRGEGNRDGRRRRKTICRVGIVGNRLAVQSVRANMATSNLVAFRPVTATLSKVENLRQTVQLGAL